MLATGALLHGRYLITRPIGRGGMAAVYEAVDARLQSTVAVKQMTANGPDSDKAFEHEAKLLAGLRHPALPVVMDYFVESGGHFLVMQFIDGDDLARTLDRAGGACDPLEVLTWARAVLDALAYLHGHQPPIVHRDIKPANLKRTPTGDIVLLDFGLAKGHARPQPRTTGDRSLYGYTLHYAPLEQLEWRPTDARSDVYALGATLFHLLTGVLPPSALQRSATVRDGNADSLSPPSVLNPLVDEAFSQVVVKAMALAPADRYGSAADMRAALPGTEAGALVVPRRRPRGRVRATRRVDAAMPSHVEVSRPADLLVQVRFPQSPLLGLEDWPTRRKPPRIEQAAGDVMLSHTVDPRTGETVPARLRIRVVAPDFSIEGQSEFVVEVPSNDYSTRLAFLLTARRPGLCRVNVEVHGLDEIFLGAIPVDTEVVNSAVTERDVQVATVVLGVIARQVVEALQRGELPAGALGGEMNRPIGTRPIDETTLTGAPRPTAIGEPADGGAEGWNRAHRHLQMPSAGIPETSRGGPVGHARPVGSWLRRGAALASLAGVAALAASMLVRDATPSHEPLAEATAGLEPVSDGARPSQMVIPGPTDAGSVSSRGASAPSTSAVGSLARAISPGSAAGPQSDRALASARRDIERTLNEFQQALVRLDIETVQRIYPTVPLSLRDQLRQAEMFTYTNTGAFVFTQLDRQAGRAVVEVDARQVWKPRSGERQESELHVTFHVFQREGTWLIEKQAVTPTTR